MHGKKVHLKENAAGHYVTHLEDWIYENGEVSVMWADNDKKTLKDRQKGGLKENAQRIRTSFKAHHGKDDSADRYV